jgi:hypothetical protein
MAGIAKAEHGAAGKEKHDMARRGTARTERLVMVRAEAAAMTEQMLAGGGQQ